MQGRHQHERDRGANPTWFQVRQTDATNTLLPCVRSCTIISQKICPGIMMPFLHEGSSLQPLAWGPREVLPEVVVVMGVVI